MKEPVSSPPDGEATLVVAPPDRGRRTPPLVAALIALGVAVVAAGVWWFMRDGSLPASPPVVDGSTAGRPLMPGAKVSAAQLVGVYQGPLQQKDGTKLWLFLEIRAAEDRAGQIAFRFFMNTAAQSETGEGLVDAEGQIRFSGLRGRVARQGRAIVLQSIGIEGPPYWRLVSQRIGTP